MKPPFFFYFVDIHVKNDVEAPRWVLIPTSTKRAPMPPAVTELFPGISSPEHVYLTRYGGWYGPGFYALWVPAGGDIWVRRLGLVGDMDDEITTPCPPAPPECPGEFFASEMRYVDLEVVIATDLVIGDAVSNPWFNEIPRGDKVADIEWSSSDEVPVSTERARKVTVGFEEDRRYTVSVPTRECCHAPGYKRFGNGSKRP